MRKLKYILLGAALVFLSTGCIKRDTMEDITIYTSSYPIYYITDYLYGESSTIKSIYPNNVDIKEYELNDKQITEYSSSQMFIFSGLGNEQKYVAPMFDKNKDLMIIDASQTMEYNYSIEELWLDPSNFLMMTFNIKNGLQEYLSNRYLKEEVEARYDELNVSISNIDANLKLISEKSDNKIIVVDNSLFKFLEKYGFVVISLEENSELNEKTVDDAKTLLNGLDNKYIYTLDEESVNDTVKEVMESTNSGLIELHSISNLTDEEEKEKLDYVDLLKSNIELFKEVLYQ